uniref:F-box domain-containing protein n=1 Tax=Meloidogyne enterolobii TaxID=390850 RepID=A0A6V7X3N3_MELEN|nr:unnamed protein product [Meloidogyne enterolobii]
MISLPLEVQLRILKYLDFNELIYVKQTNSYFCNLIIRYEGEFARRKFYELSIKSKKAIKSSNKIIDLRSTNFEFNLTDQLKEKWQAAIAKSTRLFSHSGKKLFVCMTKTEMIIVRCWLERLFKCDFGCANFYNTVFNPEMVNILFDNDKIISLQFNIKNVSLRARKNRIENILKFYLNHLSNYEYQILDIYYLPDRYINFGVVDTTDHHINILFNIIINKGNKVLEITVEGDKIAKLHDLIIEVNRLQIRSYK